MISALVSIVTHLLVQSLAQQPSSNVGPSGSTFHTVNTWPGYQLGLFADLNGDRLVDVVLIDSKGTQLSVVLAPEQTRFTFTTNADQTAMPDPVPLFQPKLLQPVRSVVGADFNGDSVLDLLMLTAPLRDGPYEAHIAYGNVNRGNVSFVNLTKLDTFVAQPLVCDLNSDMIADVYGETVAGKRIVYFGGFTMTNSSAPYTQPKWTNPGYSIFGDFDQNGVPDLAILVTHNGRLKLQLISRSQSSVGELPDTSTATYIDFPMDLTSSSDYKLGLIVSGDFDGDGEVELLLPACKTRTCEQSSMVYVYSFKEDAWTSVPVDWTPAGLSSSAWTWSLTPAAEALSLVGSSLAGVSVADVDLNGLPDLGVALTFWQGNSPVGSVPVVLLQTGEKGKLKLRAYLLSGAQLSDKRTQQIAFFDHSGKGVADVLTVSVDASNEATTQLHLQTTANDYYFLKVTVLNGLCATPSQCGAGQGQLVPGIRTALSTESANSGQHRLSSALLGSQSCCGALQLPSVTFGLGPFAEFVQHLQVAIPAGKENLRMTSFPALIPNSEVFVNPYPHNDPSKWTAYLYLRPFFDMKVVYIAITLVGVCLVLILVICVLQYLEVREDRLEKQKEAQCMAM